MFYQFKIITLILISVYCQNQLQQCLIQECGITLNDSLEPWCKSQEFQCQGFLDNSFNLCETSICVVNCQMNLTKIQKICQQNCFVKYEDESYRACNSVIRNSYNNGSTDESNFDSHNHSNESDIDSYNHSSTNENDTENSEHESNQNEDGDGDDKKSWILPVVICSVAFVVIVLVICLIRKILIRRKKRTQQPQIETKTENSSQKQENKENQSQDNYIIPEGIVDQADEKIINRIIQQNNRQNKYPQLQQFQINSNQTPQENLAESCPIQNAVLDNQINVQATPNNLY